MFDDSDFIINIPTPIVSIKNEDGQATNEVSIEKRIDDDGNVRRLIQRQTLKDHDNINSNQFISRDEIFSKQGTPTSISEKEYTKDLTTNHEKLKLSIKILTPEKKTLFIEKNRIQDSDSVIMESQETRDSKNILIRKSETLIQPISQNDLFFPTNSEQNNLKGFVYNENNFYL